ncbi:MAG: hypothetical protein JWQ23_3283 [Herminiimonas sp.]|nr:hypothetical protein [Herminiimonas sp.]
MMTIKILFISTILLFAVGTRAQDGNPVNCSQLAEIGANAYRTKADGYPMQQVLGEVGAILKDPQVKDAAHGAIMAIYEDAYIKSPAQAYRKVYAACKN